jgi:ketosteroid isomerase-like protein
MHDKIEIQETISRYHEGASTFDLEQIIATFLPDAVWEVPSMNLRAEGHQGLRETMGAVIASLDYLVQINAPAIIEVDGDRASARSLIRECTRFREGDVYMDVVGQFNDRLERTAHGWKFARRVFTVLGTETTKGTR